MSEVGNISVIDVSWWNNFVQYGTINFEHMTLMVTFELL